MGAHSTSTQESEAPVWSGQERSPALDSSAAEDNAHPRGHVDRGRHAGRGHLFLLHAFHAQDGRAAAGKWSLRPTASPPRWGNSATARDTVQLEFNALDKTPNLEFVVMADPGGHQVAGFVADRSAWWDYRSTLEKNPQAMNQQLGMVHEVEHPHDPANGTSYAVTVPVFSIGPHGESGGLVGYLHASFATTAMAGQLRFLQAFVLVTCMAVVLLAIPIAGRIARHITVPIQRLALGAHALAEGDLSHRVIIKRRDELGELADAFNRMADTVERQQADIKQINAGLEEKIQDRTAELERLNKRLHRGDFGKRGFPSCRQP